MRAREECLYCLEKLARRNSLLSRELGCNNDQEALKEGLDYLAKSFSFQEMPTRLAGEMQRLMRQVLGLEGPFVIAKKAEMKTARMLAAANQPAAEAGLKELVAFAAAGNSMDFFMDEQALLEEMKKPVSFIRDDIEAFGNLLLRLSYISPKPVIIYLADNAGECHFDLPLVKHLESYGEVYYVVKEGPVQNDLTLADLECSGIWGDFSKVASTGTDTPGLDLGLASKEFKDLFMKASLIVAKGMAHYETVPEMTSSTPVLLLLKAKCRPVAESLGIKLDNYAAVLINRNNT